MTHPAALSTEQRIRRSLSRRHRAEARFRFYGKLAIALASASLVFLLYNIVIPGISGFVQHQVQVVMRADMVKESGGNAQKAVVSAFRATLKGVRDDRTKRLSAMLLSQSASFVWQEMPNTKLPTTIWLPLSDAADQYLKGKPVSTLGSEQIGWLKDLQQAGRLKAAFNKDFFLRGDSRDPDQAGFLGSVMGSFFSLAICIAISFIVGVLSAIYLEEFARKNWLTDVIEVNINNLAAVPSIIFGLLGLALFLNVFGLPRSSALVGGLTLALMTLPVIIITTRVALKSVPPSIRDAARALGASPQQVVWHHVVPYALPGMMTGAILGLSRAIGETAPLLMIGMVAFVADVPRGFLDAATAMPVQIYVWASSPEMGFVEKTSTGIIVLLAVLIVMNSIAIFIRRKTEVRWS